MPSDDGARANGRASKPLISRGVAQALLGGAAALTVLLLIVEVTEPWGWDISTTALGLIGVLIVIPLAEQIRELSFGGLTAKIGERVEHLEHRVTDLSEATTAPAGDEDRVRTRIVWVDDRPEGNRLEIAELGKSFDVITATSTEKGIVEVRKKPDSTMAISDAVREERGETNHDAGVEFLRAVKKQFPQVAVYIYCGPGTVELQGQALENAGAELVTASWTELARVLKADARRPSATG